MSAQPAADGRAARWLKRAALAWLALVALSHVVWIARNDAPARADGLQALTLALQTARGAVPGTTELVYRDVGPRDAPVLLLIHGSPGGLENYDELVPFLGAAHRLIVPDLPGFGASRAALPDYSIAAHARYLAALLAELGVERVHVVGFSMGGGVALHLADLAPARVASVALVSAIGVQELELFGSYELNHGVHAMQLAGAWGARLALPHFGARGGLQPAVAWAHNFYDTDQRPLRGLLEAFEAPLLVVHGARDVLVPVEAAREHRRLVPQSELVEVEDQNHFLLWTWTEPLVDVLARFVARVEDGAARRRADADPARVAAAAEPFDPAGVPKFSGLALVVAMLLLALSTLASEDLACIGAGLLVAQGRMDFTPATFACFLGIFIGDVGLYVVGAAFGRPALRRAPLRWLISEDAVTRAAAWFRERGARVVFISRFMPGLRLPTYVSAGVLRTGFVAFCLWFVLAGALWTPLLVGFSAWAGLELGAAADQFGRFALWGLVLLVGGLLFFERLLVPALTWRGRRTLVGKWRRRTQWEFWPPWVFYAPVGAYFVWLCLRYRGLACTAANPGIFAGGFVNESKQAILEGFGLDAPEVGRWSALRAAAPPEQRVALARAFRAEHGLELPIVLKPDAGQRGSGVLILRDEERFEAAVRELRVDSILQEFVPGPEFGIFYVRRPGAARGSILSVTEKHLPTVTGDGVRTLEQLILADPRAVAMSKAYFHEHAARLFDVPARGAEVTLVSLGTHARGALFRDGRWVLTPALEDAIEHLSRRFEGFSFGRYDVRADTVEELQAGRFRVIELNGVTSECTHIYHPRTTLREAYATLFHQWRLAFEIGAAHARAGAPTVGALRILREAWRYRRAQRAHR